MFRFTCNFKMVNFYPYEVNHFLLSFLQGIRLINSNCYSRLYLLQFNVYMFGIYIFSCFLNIDYNE